MGTKLDALVLNFCLGLFANLLSEKPTLIMPSLDTENPSEFIPTTQAELSRFVAENAKENQQALFPVGGRTALHFGFPAKSNGVAVTTSKLTNIIDYPARDMTITVEAGIRMDQLTAELKKENQRLPVDVAQSHRATLGGVVATNTSGPRRFGQGTMRDYVIGISAIDAQGRLFSAGGRVVKNVAGYDLCKLLTGSMGTLAIITQLTLKLRPNLESSALVWANLASFTEIDTVLEQLLTSETRPTAVEVLDIKAAGQIANEARLELPTDQPVLCIGFEGSQTETDWQVEKIKQELGSLASQEIAVISNKKTDPLWKALTEFQIHSDEPVTFQATLLPSKAMEFLDQATQAGVSVQAHAGNGIVIGHLPDDTTTLEKAAEILTPLRQFTRKNHGNLSILNCNDDWKKQLPVFGDSEPSTPLMKKLKAQLDPHNLLNPGRFVNH